VKVFVAVTFCIVLVTGLATGQTQRLPQRPVFRGGISVVPVDVRVVDGSGRPVTDLKQEDFTIKEDGIPQVVTHFSTVAFKADSSMTTADPDVRTGRAADLTPQNRRVFLIVLGRGRHQSASKYVDALSRFVSTRILPQDYVAILAWNRATDFTPDKTAIAALLERYRQDAERIETDLREWFSGLRAVYGPKDIPARIQKQIDAVFADAAGLRPRQLTPTSIDAPRAFNQTQIGQKAADMQRERGVAARIAAGENVLADPMAAHEASLTDLSFDEYIAQMTEVLHDVGNLYAGIGYLRVLDGEKHLVLLTERGISMPSQDGNASLARVAADARIALDFVQTGGVVTAPPAIFVPFRGAAMQPTASSNQVFAQTFAIQDLRLMAERTGGQVMAFQTGEEAFRRLDDGMRFQYLLGYTPSNGALDSKFRKISVGVNRRGVRVVVREGYFAVDTPILPDRRQMVTFNRIRAAGEYFDVIDHIKLRLGKPVLSGNEVSIDVTVDISRVHFVRQGVRQEAVLDIAMFCGDEKGQPVGDAQKSAELRFDDTAFARAQQQGTTFKMTVPVRGDVRSIKVIVYDYGADLVGSAVAKVSR